MDPDIVPYFYTLCLFEMLLYLWLCIVPLALGASWIAPGAVWYDTDGKKINAHGGGIVQRESTFYWVGHSAENQTPMMYSSTDLINWKNLGAQSTVSAMWRPKLAKPNGSFWLFGQQDRYSLSLKSSQLNGGYVQSAKVYLPPNLYSYSDTGMFHDPVTDTWYLLTSADHNIVQINKINADGTVGAQASSLIAGAYEAPGLFYADGVYFLICSGKTGWRANPNKVFWATSIAGPWTGGTDIAPSGENTYGSQNTFELTISGSQKTTHIFMGDAWDSKGGASSNYVWLPMTVDTSRKKVTLDYHAMWAVDVKTGAISSAKADKRYEAYHVLGKRTAGGLNEITFRNVTGTGAMQWLAFDYTVNKRNTGEAYIIVNNEPPVNISSLNSRAGYHHLVPVQLKLEAGDDNTIVFGSMGQDDFETTITGIESF
ncbi:glycosyl hydrolase [Xylaria bambusicola]|uniref:glycosyl hydrolase n=1 Tax=Xylaria bambusicola TaxID=326684 RepID=UPI0020083EE9|nr:glycosyl hydrolase [Xylaria bambusicola]KAI0517013.1 glycosyl hydrolase [Xylaria bambusicola]